MTATGSAAAEGNSSEEGSMGHRAAAPLRGRAGFLKGTGAQDAGDLLTVEGLPLEQGARQRVQLLDVVLEDLLGTARGLQDDPLDLRVDDEGGVFAVVFRPSDLAAEEDVLLVLAEGQGPELSDMPHSQIILRAISVAFSRSSPAPVVCWFRTISSAARPPSRIVMRLTR